MTTELQAAAVAAAETGDTIGIADEEIVVIEECVRALQKLTELGARSRVLNYLDARFIKHLFYPVMIGAGAGGVIGARRTP